MFINFTDNIISLERENIEKYNIYQLNDEELKEFKEAYKIVKKQQIKLQEAKEAYIAKKNFIDEEETKKIEIEYERELKEFNKYKFDGTYELVFVKKEKVEKYDFDLYTNEEFVENIEKELLLKILPGRIKINNNFVSRLFFMYEGIGISKIDQLFSLEMFLLQNEWYWCFEVENSILGIFDQVTINNQNIWFDGFIDKDSNLNEIFDKKIEYFDRMKVVDILFKEIEYDGILTLEYEKVSKYEEYRVITVTFPYKEIFKIKSNIYFKDCFEYIFNNLFKKYTVRTLLKLNGFYWKEEYEKDEQLFCDEIMAKLLRKMNFSPVLYYHGKKEYGKDFIFSETDRFGHRIHYGLQVKAGNISGKANSKIDEIIAQLNDAFAMPFEEIGSENKYYISNFIIAISGNFTENAKDKIKYKIQKEKLGSVFFLDKERIIQLAEKYW